MALKFKLFFVVFLFLWGIQAQPQPDNGVLRMNDSQKPQMRQIITIPDVEGLQVLKCDFHQHTVFSDGHVWPNVRVQEAWQEGIDAIAITDHVEYHPHSADVVVDHNRAFEIAKKAAEENNIIFIKGTEISRRTPPGHFNAIFIGDASDYISDTDNSNDKASILKAVEQKAFIFWNHPGWKANQIEGSYEWIDFVDELYREKALHGIEVFNGFGFHKKALDWCVDKGLTVIGSTDSHNLIAHTYALGGPVHRTMTLAFAKERTAVSLREALEAGCTVAWSGKYLAGKEEHLKKLFHACVTVSPSYHSIKDRETVVNYYEIQNKSDLYFELQLKSGNRTQSVTLHPGSSQKITATAGQKSLACEVTNAYVRSDQCLVTAIPLN